MADDLPSLLSLEDELSCSICLCPFENPVTLPCGHNFCQGCLDETWKESFLLFCPQCRHHYPSKPDLKKNTVLSAVVSTFKAKSTAPSDTCKDELVESKQLDVIKCDTCMEAKALKTCLTCMASYCEVHVKPHQDNPIFRLHQLTDPMGDLMERICQDHSKIMEFFCVKHSCSICSSCLQQTHRGCEYTSPQERRTQKESEMRGMLNQLDRKVDKNNLVLAQMKEQLAQLQDDADVRKKQLSRDYELMRELLSRDEQEALKAVDKEVASGQTKLQALVKKFRQNVEKMNDAKMEISSHMAQADSLAFLEVTVQLPSNATFDPYCPRISLNSKAVIGYHTSTVALKEYLINLLAQPPDNRIPLFKPGLIPEDAFVRNSPEPNFIRAPAGVPQRDLRSPSPGAPLFGHGSKMTPRPAPPNKKTPKGPKGNEKHGKKPPKIAASAALSKSTTDLHTAVPSFDVRPSRPIVRDLSTAVKRSDLLQFGTVLQLDPWTAHKRIALSENLTKATVVEEPCPYPDNPNRFTICSQVLCSKGFSQGRHYWEVKMSCNNFCGLGLAYKRLDRKGPSSRLGRNDDSWCVEWFNIKLSAWHDSQEVVLENPSPSRVGVLLDCEEGAATFYSISDRAYPFHTFVFPFVEAVYPAFWIFSAGSSISLCKLTG